MRSATRRRPLWFRIVGALFYIVFCATILLAGSAFGYLKSGKLGQAIISDWLHPRTPNQIFNSDTLTILILGCDEDRAPNGGKVLKASARSDMILLVKVDFKHNRIGGISIPRDLLWGLPGYSKRKINAYYAAGGSDLAKAAVEDVLGIKIDRVIALNFDAFEEMVNVVGGVDVFVQKDLDYDDDAGDLHIHIEAGNRHLNGYNAMGFVRMRHSDSDFMRQARQKDFILAFKQTLVRKPWLLNAVASKAQDALGGAFTMDEIYSLAKFTKTVPGESMKMGMTPIIEGRKGTRYGYYVDLDTAKLPDALREFHVVDAPTSKAAQKP